MSLRGELLSSCAKVLVVPLSDGFRRAVWLGDSCSVKLAEHFFTSMWNNLMRSNPMFMNKYNLEAKI